MLHTQLDNLLEPPGITCRHLPKHAASTKKTIRLGDKNMSHELNCVKHAIFGGTYAELPSDVTFLSEEGFEDPLNYLTEIWTFPDPCYFVWCTSEQLEQIKNIDTDGSALLEKHTSELNGVPMHLLRVPDPVFFRLKLKPRVELDGETGFLCQSIKRSYEKW